MTLPTEHLSEGPMLSPALMSECRTEQMGLSETMRSSSVERWGGFQDKLSEKPNAEEPPIGSSGCARKKQNEVHVFAQLSRGDSGGQGWGWGGPGKDRSMTRWGTPPL